MNDSLDIMLSQSIHASNPGLFFTILQQNYYCCDNMQRLNDPKINPCSTIYNDNNHCVISVQHGTMNLVINGQEVKLKSNDFLVIMPFTRIEVLTSFCSFFSCASHSTSTT